jgi:REP element-mobilizing transposase RayT
MQNKKQILLHDTFYHIYNRANGNENIFITEGNYAFFLKQFKQYIHPIAYLYCYCLLPNHFHFLIQIKSENELNNFFNKEKGNLTFLKFQNLEKLTSKQFSNFFSSYTQALNKEQGRKGSLFMKNFKRKKIENKQYLYKLVHYIHYNPIEAGLCQHLSEWRYSSYNAICFDANTLIKKEQVIEWFEDLENFKFIHTLKPKELEIVFD